MNPPKKKTPENLTDDKAEEALEADTSEVPEEAQEEALSEAEALREELTSCQDALARAHAELDNVQKRHIRERESAQRYRVEPLARELPGLYDALDDACRMMEQQAEAVPDSLREGQALILRQLEGIFQKFGIEVIDPAGKPFDPQLHEAMTMIPSPGATAGEVLEVLRKGYCLHDRLLRAAQVVVAAEVADDESESPKEAPSDESA